MIILSELSVIYQWPFVPPVCLPCPHNINKHETTRPWGHIDHTNHKDNTIRLHNDTCVILQSCGERERTKTLFVWFAVNPFFVYKQPSYGYTSPYISRCMSLGLMMSWSYVVTVVVLAQEVMYSCLLLILLLWSLVFFLWSCILVVVCWYCGLIVSWYCGYVGLFLWFCSSILVLFPHVLLLSYSCGPIILMVSWFHDLGHIVPLSLVMFSCGLIRLLTCVLCSSDLPLVVLCS